MRKLTDLAAIIRDTALRKQRAAEMHRSGAPEELPEPGAVFRDVCAAIGQALAADGFRYAKSGPHLTRKAGDFTYRISFQSSAHNVRGEYVALWIHAMCYRRASRLGEDASNHRVIGISSPAVRSGISSQTRAGLSGMWQSRIAAPPQSKTR